MDSQDIGDCSISNQQSTMDFHSHFMQIISDLFKEHIIKYRGEDTVVQKFEEHLKNEMDSYGKQEGDEIETSSSNKKEVGQERLRFKLIFKNGRTDACEVQQIARREKSTIYEALNHIASSAADPKKHEVDDVVGQLVKQENLNYIGLNLYNIKDGFFKLFTRATEKHFLCEMSYVKHALFLEEIDRGEVPLELLVMLSDLKDKFIYDKYVIMKVNDYVTKSGSYLKNVSPFFSYFTLLKLSYKTLRAIAETEAVNEVALNSELYANSICDEELIYILKQKILKKESKLLVQFSDPLYLDPTPISLQEQFQLKNNSLSYPKLQECLHSNWQSFLESSSDRNSLSRFLKANETPEMNEEIVNKFIMKCVIRTCLKTFINFPGYTFENFLKRRMKGRQRRYRLPALNEEFSFECIKVIKFLEDGKEKQRWQVLKKSFFSIFRTKQGPLIGKITYPCKTKNRRIIHRFRLRNASKVNKALQEHAKRMTNGMESRYLKVIHKIPYYPAYVGYTTVPFHPSQIKTPLKYRESKIIDLKTDTKHRKTTNNKLTAFQDKPSTSKNVSPLEVQESKTIDLETNTDSRNTTHNKLTAYRLKPATFKIKSASELDESETNNLKTDTNSTKSPKGKLTAFHDKPSTSWNNPYNLRMRKK